MRAAAAAAHVICAVITIIRTGRIVVGVSARSVILADVVCANISVITL